MKDSGAQRKETLAQTLKTSILTLAMRPGDDLDEAALSEQFGLSRTPLREVFRELAGAGFIELRAGRGARVADMSYATLRDFFLAAPMIYGAILRLAAQNATRDQIDDLIIAQEDFKKALSQGDIAARSLANNRFHEITGEMAGNIYLLPSFSRLLIDHARISMTFYQENLDHSSDKIQAASAQHDAIIEAIKLRDSERAADLAIAHWNLSRDQIEQFVMPSALDHALGDVPSAL
jgi:DNA-binding GntR family transcriptional regulator